MEKKKIETTKQLQKKDFMATISQVVKISSERFIYWMLKMIVVRINDDDYDESDDDADDNAWKDWTILDDQLGGWTLCAHKADDWVQFQGQTTTNYY